MVGYWERRSQKQAAGQAKARSDAIDRQIEEDKKDLKNKCDILLLGSSLFLI